MTKRLCSVPGCTNTHMAKGCCHTHYYRKRRSEVDWARPVRVTKARGKACILKNCHRPAKYLIDERRVCHTHYKRFKDGVPDWDAEVREYRARLPGGGQRVPMRILVSQELYKALQAAADARATTPTTVAAELLARLVKDTSWVQRAIRESVLG